MFYILTSQIILLPSSSHVYVGAAVMASSCCDMLVVVELVRRLRAPTGDRVCGARVERFELKGGDDAFVY